MKQHKYKVGDKVRVFTSGDYNNGSFHQFKIGEVLTVNNNFSYIGGLLAHDINNHNQFVKFNEIEPYTPKLDVKTDGTTLSIKVNSRDERQDAIKHLESLGFKCDLSFWNLPFKQMSKPYINASVKTNNGVIWESSILPFSTTTNAGTAPLPTNTTSTYPKLMKVWDRFEKDAIDKLVLCEVEDGFVCTEPPNDTNEMTSVSGLVTTYSHAKDIQSPKSKLIDRIAKYEKILSELKKQL